MDHTERTTRLVDIHFRCQNTKFVTRSVITLDWLHNIPRENKITIKQTLLKRLFELGLLYGVWSADACTTKAAEEYLFIDKVELVI